MLRKMGWLVLAGLFAVSLVQPLSIAAQERGPDPNGSITGGAADVPAKTLEELAAHVGKNRVAVNFIWVVISGAAVMFMQCGFLMVETGLGRIKNAAHSAGMNFMIYPLCVIGYWAVGFALMFGGIGPLGTLGGYAGLNSEIAVGGFGLFGAKGFMLSGAAYDVAVFTLFMFQMVFMATTATIVTGACLERFRFSAFVPMGIAVGAILYPVYGNWVWGGGWLAQLGTKFGLGHGVVDYAGSSVVHLQGGLIALVYAYMLGPRIGKYNADGSANTIAGHNIPMVLNGCMLLGFCWFFFNAGSSLAAADLRLSVTAVNTCLASVAGSFVAMLWSWRVRGTKPDPSMFANGLLAGLVAITAPCAFVNSISAVIIGAVSGVLVVEAVFFFDRIHIDDPVSALSVHGVNGLWGAISLGLFADGTYGDGLNGVAGGVKGLFYGDGGQLVAQIIGPLAAAAYLIPATYVIYKVSDAIFGCRSSKEEEIKGLDVPSFGVEAYPWFDATLGAAEAAPEQPKAPVK